MAGPQAERESMIQAIAGPGLHRLGVAAVLLHHALAGRLGLGARDQQCLDLLVEHGAMTGSELAGLTGLTTGAVTGVVARLEREGFIRRTADPSDGRKQTLSPVVERMGEVHGALQAMHASMAELLEGCDVRQLEAIGRFLEGSSELALRHALRLRAEVVAPGGRGGRGSRSRSQEEARPAGPQSVGQRRDRK